MDKVPGRRERVRSGGIIAESMNEKPSQAVPHGLIHDWIGVVFIPQASLSDVFAIVRDYETYGDYYGPTSVPRNSCFAAATSILSAFATFERPFSQGLRSM